MTPGADATAANTSLAKVAQQGLLHVDFDVVRQVAMAVWHGQDRVDLREVQGPYLADALSLLERLSFYNVVPQDRKKALLEQVRQLRTELVPGNASSRDEAESLILLVAD